MSVDTPSNQQDNAKGTFLKNIIIWIKFLFASVKFKIEAKQLVLFVNKIRIDQTFKDFVMGQDDLDNEARISIANVMKCSLAKANLIIEALIKAQNQIDTGTSTEFLSEFFNFKVSNITGDNNFHQQYAILFKLASVALIEIAKDKGITLKEYEADFIINAAYSLERQK